MPLVGIKCEYKGNVPWDNCVACAKSHNNPCGHPAEIVEGIRHFTDTEGMTRKGMISITSLLGCIRATFLEQMNPYYETLDSLWWSFRGQLAHVLAEQFKQEDAIVEKRFYRTVGEITVSGKMDAVYPKYKMIRDFKTCKAVPKKDMPYSNHIEQVSGYKWLLANPDNEAPIVIEKAKITYMDMNQTKTLEAPLKDSDKVEARILEKASILHHAFKTGEIPDVPTEYPTYWKCNGYCSMCGQCAEVWKLGQKK